MKREDVDLEKKLKTFEDENDEMFKKQIRNILSEYYNISEVDEEFVEALLTIVR